MMKQSIYNIWVQEGKSAYVFNGASGALLRVSDRDSNALRHFLANEDVNCSPEILEAMIRGRMLVSDHCDELESLAQTYTRSRYDRTHFGLTIVTSLGCNFDCPYCFEAKHPSIMNAEVQQAILSVLDNQMPEIRSFHVTWFGGEPLVGKKSLLALSDAFIQRCDSHGVDYTAAITTNGFLLDEETCVELRQRKVGSVQVCLDGPPEVHDKMRPLRNGRGSFWQIVKNLHHATLYLDTTIRMNVDTQNIGDAEKLLQILAAEGLAGKLTIYIGQIVGINDGAPSPSASYKRRCLNNREFAEAERRFTDLARSYKFGVPSLPEPTGAPCTAVRANELVVGSKGELYKCWDSVGNPHEVVGDIRGYQDTDSRLRKWLQYDPFADAECRSCIALPVCMGGCAHHAMDSLQYENRCGTFRHTYREQVLAFVKAAEETGTTNLATPVRITRKVETR